MWSSPLIQLDKAKSELYILAEKYYFNWGEDYCYVYDFIIKLFTWSFVNVWRQRAVTVAIWSHTDWEQLNKNFMVDEILLNRILLFIFHKMHIQLQLIPHCPGFGQNRVIFCNSWEVGWLRACGQDSIIIWYDLRSVPGSGQMDFPFQWRRWNSSMFV